MVALFLLVLAAVFTESVVVCRLCSLGLFLGCIALALKEPKFINPYFLFSLTPLSLTIYDSIGGVYILPLSHETWVIGIINIYAFLVAVYFTPSFKNVSNCIGVSSKSGLIIGAIIMYLIGFIPRFMPQLTPLFWFTSFAAMVFALKSKSKIGFIFCVYLFLSSAFSGHSSKMTMLLYVITFMVCYEKFYVISRWDRRKMFLFIAVGVVFMISAFSFANKERGDYDSKEGQIYYETQGRFEWDYNSSLLMPYLYFTTPWTNVEYVIHSQDQRTNGLWIIKPLLGYFGLDENFEEEYVLIPYSSSFNTFTFVCCGFKDFGYWLSIFSAMFLGIFVKIIYTRYLITRSPFDITSYIMVALATAEMFFSNHFFMQSYPFTALIMMEFYKYVTFLVGNKKIDIELN